ncbi:UPF0755 protein [Tibeticola sediminis]|uniref:Endolytic murein transglycosylase n=1 Tax=Tibeticola sediminis TaxID=1917811 RepID=A0A3N4UTK0_9BURK|nr:UPF0755 protein [Tibeticola sediminis]
MRRVLKALWVTVLLLGGAGLWWIHQPLPISGEAVDLSIEPGTPPRAVAQAVADAGVPVSPLALYAWFRLSGQARQIRAGNYALEPGTTPRSLLRKLVRGEESLRTLTIVEGWNWRQVRAALAQASDLRADSRALDDATLMQALGRPGVAPEGRFFPDTYTYAKGASDLSILARAMRAMDHQLAAAWALRASDLPLASAEEALILASIIEKETAREQDRRLIAGVFINRLRRGMPLQTDPTVIYGLGERFDGNLRKRDLQTDTPWNTYTRSGLPPTPIAMPGRASLLAAVQPATTDAIYFVARGDGSSHFSATLEEHNRAVNRYQRGQ